MKGINPIDGDPPPAPPQLSEKTPPNARFLSELFRDLSTPLGPTVAGVELRRSHLFRLVLASALIAASTMTNRGFLAWGLLFILGVLVVPVGRARSFLVAFIPYVGVWFAFTLSRSLADETVLAKTLNTAAPTFERRLFGGQLPTVRLQDRYFTTGSLSWWDYLLTGVHWSYFIVPHIVAIMIWYRRPDLFRRFLSALTLMLGIGLLIYFLLPSNPPWLAPEQNDSPSAPVVYRVMEQVAEQIGGGLYQASYRVVGESNPRAAMPSIHMAYMTLLVFPAFAFGRRWGILATLYAGLMGFALIYLGEHYFIDIVVGAGIAAYGWFAAATWFETALPVLRGPGKFFSRSSEFRTDAH